MQTLVKILSVAACMIVAGACFSSASNPKPASRSIAMRDVAFQVFFAIAFAAAAILTAIG